jgi:hypothetical protein
LAQVDIDKDIEKAFLCPSRRSHRRDRFRIVHNCLYVALSGQFDKTSDLALAGKFAGDKDVRNSVRDQCLGFLQRPPRHADGSGIHLTVG